MKYKELLTHLLNLKILSYCDRHKETVAEYIRSIDEVNLFEIEVAILESDDKVSKKRKKKILNVFEKEGVKIFSERIEKHIDVLLQECGMTNSMIEQLPLTLTNLLETFNPPQCKPLTDFVFGEGRGNHDIEGIRTRPQLIKFYETLLENGFYNLTFIEYFSLVEGFSIRLMEVFENSKQQFSEALKLKKAEERKHYVREMYVRYGSRIQQSPYIWIGKNLSTENVTILEIASLLNGFTRTTPVKFEAFKEQEDKILQFFSDNYFYTYLDDNYHSVIETVGLDEEEVFNIINNRNQLSAIMRIDNIDLFGETERELIKLKYFDKKGGWSRDKKDLVEFISYCLSIGYFSVRPKKLNDIRRLFEERYMIEIKKQFQPKQRAYIDLKFSQFSWVKPPK